VGIFGGDTEPAFTYGFGAAALIAIVITLSVPAWYGHWVPHRKPLPTTAGRLRKDWRHAVDALGEGTADSVVLLHKRPVGVLAGSLGYMGFDIASLGFCFLALGHAPGIGVLTFAYLVGQLGGLVPLPGGIGGTEGGLIGAFAIYHFPLATTVAAVLAYRALQLWIPAVLGSIAFVQLRRTLRRESTLATVCEPLAEPITGGVGSANQRSPQPQGA
jgi:uncharacterized membrane protein YbhN (UPF0104 family)